MAKRTTRLMRGDALSKLQSLENASIDSIVTDPPYELGFMGKAWDASGIAYNIELWRECLRVLKPGGHLLAFGGTRTYHRMAVAIEDAGFEIRDSIQWVYGSGFPKSLDVSKAIGKQWQGWGTALKPAHEPIVVARKALCGTVAANVLEHGTGAINIDGCRVEDDSSTAGRWPANFIHDGSEDVLALFPDTKGGTWNTTKGARHFNNDGEPTGYETSKTDNSVGSAARFFYCAKPNKKERNAGLEKLPTVRHSDRVANDLPGGDNPRNRTNKDKTNFHPTVKPLALMRYLVRLVTPPGGIVLDPFLGSGTTAAAAILEGFDWRGCEMTAEYYPIIAGRVKNATAEKKRADATNAAGASKHKQRSRNG
jgi:DNA modification methylase